MSAGEKQKRKCYGQRCPLGRALDVVGDRWTILILRELLGGPAHFQELHDGLPGIAKNLLTARLRRLESDEIVRRLSLRTTSPYALTEQGAAVRQALEHLGRTAGVAWFVAVPESRGPKLEEDDDRGDQHNQRVVFQKCFHVDVLVVWPRRPVVDEEV